MKNTLLTIIFFSSTCMVAQSDYKTVLQQLDDRAGFYRGVANEIWEFAELGYQEEQSSALLQQTLSDEGFTIARGVAEIPTAFVASYGSGSPVIAILGEYDALPGMSQKAVPYRVSNNAPAGHACGHHLFSTASAAAAITLKNYLAGTKQSGTIKFYGCPAEEGGSGKVYMTRAGLFDGVDVALHWHPGDNNAANPAASLANKSAKFRFYGVSAHAAINPEKGRSALDGVEAMNHMVNLMREHIPSSARIHYAITSGGKAPNRVPDFAEVYYYVRHGKRDVVMELFERLVNAANGAALGTGTTVDYEMIGGVHELLGNEVLQTLVYTTMNQLGGFEYTTEEVAFAEEILKTLNKPLDLRGVHDIMPYDPNQSAGASTDIGDVSFTVPTVGFSTATWVPGVYAHTWQAVACGGTSIASKGMLLAAKTLALTGMQLLDDPKYVDAAQKEFLTKRGSNFKYIPLLGDRAPALDYRN